MVIALFALDCGGDAVTVGRVDDNGSPSSSSGSADGSSGSTDGSASDSSAGTSDSSGSSGSSGNTGGSSGDASGSSGVSSSTGAGAAYNSRLPDYYPNYTKGPYGFCGGPNGIQCSGMIWGMGNGGRGSSEDCDEHCLCEVSCSRDADCPDAGSGRSTPTCQGGRCILPCESETDCPDGMACGMPPTDPFGLPSLCHWHSAVGTEQACAPEPCDTYEDRDDCLDWLTNNPFRPDTGCIWVHEAIYSTASEECTPASETERCVPGRRVPEDSLNVLACDPDGAWVFWADIGAGTAQITKTDPGFMPIAGDFFDPEEYRQHDACEPGDPPLPLLCACGCE